MHLKLCLHEVIHEWLAEEIAMLANTQKGWSTSTESMAGGTHAGNESIVAWKVCRK